jgi:hypothetical protein
MITVNPAKAVQEAAAPLAYKKNTASTNLLVGHADRHDDIARSNVWRHRLAVNNGESHATHDGEESERGDNQ